MRLLDIDSTSNYTVIVFRRTLYQDLTPKIIDGLKELGELVFFK